MSENVLNGQVVSPEDSAGRSPNKEMRREVGSRRVEKEFVEWLKILFEIIYGCIMTLFYILLEISQLVYPKKSKSLAGQHILVTGAARGLGREICLRLVREGCSLTLVDVWKEGVEETAQLCNQLRPATALPLYCDITDRKQVSELVSKVAPVDILINNAGIVSSAGILEVTEEHIEKMMNVNVMAHYWTIRAFLPGMIQRGRGHIVAVASAAAFTAAANIAPYTATKYAVTGLMASLREEFRHFYPKIKTTTIHPFFITPPNSNVDHWDKTSRLPDVTAVEVAERTVRGIKKERITVTIPHHLYFLLMLLHFLPSTAGELWRDMFYAKINPLDKTKVKTS